MRPPSLTRRSAVVLLAAPFVARPARAAPTRWVFYTSQIRGSVGAKGWQTMVERVKAGSDGGFEITLATAGRLGVDANAISAAVTAGSLVLGDDAYYGQFFPAAGVARLPLIAPDRTAFNRGLRAMKTFLSAAYDARDAVFLAQSFAPPVHAFSSLRFDNYAGLAGRRIRAVSPEQGDFIRRLGAIPLALPTASVPRALTSRELDTVFATAAGGGSLWAKQLKGGYANGLHHTDSVLIAAKSAFEALPGALRDLLLHEADTAARAITDAQFAEEEAAIRRLAGEGVELAEQQSDDVRAMTAKMQIMWDDWARVRGPQAQDLLFAYRRALDVQ